MNTLIMLDDESVNLSVSFISILFNFIFICSSNTDVKGEEKCEEWWTKFYVLSFCWITQVIDTHDLYCFFIWSFNLFYLPYATWCCQDYQIVLQQVAVNFNYFHHFFFLTFLLFTKKLKTSAYNRWYLQFFTLNLI